MSNHCEVLAEKLEKTIGLSPELNADQILNVFVKLLDGDEKLRRSMCRLEWSYGVDLLNNDPEEDGGIDIDEEEVLSVDYVYEVSDSGVAQVRVCMMFLPESLDVEELPADDGFLSDPKGFRTDVLESEVFLHIAKLRPEKIQVWGGWV